MSTTASTTSSRTGTLLTVAAAGAGAGLLARGILLIVLAPTLAAGIASGTTGSVVSPRPSRADRGARTMIPFPQLAPERDETVTPVEATAATPKKGTGPLVPLAATLLGIMWFDDPALSVATLGINNEISLHAIRECPAAPPPAPVMTTVAEPQPGVINLVKQATPTAAKPGVTPTSSVAPCNLVSAGYKLVRIEPRSVFLLHEASGQEQEISLRGKKKKAVVAETTSEGPTEPAGDSKGKGSNLSQMMDQVKQTGPNHWEAPPGMRDNVLGRLNEVAMEGRWLPYFENGKIVGFKLAQMVPNSAFEKIGLKTGDIIKSVNGFDISSPDKMLDVFTKLKDARDLNVDVQRGGGKKATLSYTIN